MLCYLCLCCSINGCIKSEHCCIGCCNCDTLTVVDGVVVSRTKIVTGKITGVTTKTVNGVVVSRTKTGTGCCDCVTDDNSDESSDINPNDNSGKANLDHNGIQIGDNRAASGRRGQWL